jgi:hypothetical protein
MQIPFWAATLLSAGGDGKIAQAFWLPHVPFVDESANDDLGRHNSTGIQSWSWHTFGGDLTHLSGGNPYSSMDTVSISPI